MDVEAHSNVTIILYFSLIVFASWHFVCLLYFAIVVN